MLHRFGTIFLRPEEGSGTDVNSTGGFTEALALAAGRELTDEEKASLAEIPDRSVAGGLTEESPAETQRDESGRFAPVATPAPEPAAEEPAPPEEQELDPLTKQLQDSQKFIGEQGRILGEERARREALEQRLAVLEEGQQQEDPADAGIFIPGEEDREILSDMFDSIGGPGMMSRIATSAPEAIDAAMALWKAGGDWDLADAYLYEENVNRLISEAQGSENPAAPELPPEVMQLAQRERMQSVVAEVADSLGDEGKLLAPFIAPALQTAGALTKQAIGEAIDSGDPERQKAAFNEIISLARAQKGTSQGQRQEQVRETKRQAQVLTGSGRPSAVRQPGEGLPRSKEEFEQLTPTERRAAATKLVADQFEKTETTSVAAGLTFGSQP